jgi:hypothetical protein
LLATAIFTGWYAVTARDTEERELRAYIGIVVVDFTGPNTFVPPNYPSVHFNVRNYGSTPAHSVTHEGAIKSCAYPLPKNFDFAIPAVATSPEPITVFPGTPDNLGIEATSDRALTPAEFAEIGIGNNRVCFFGTVHYWDVFGFKWYSNYCYSFFGTAVNIRHEACERHNEAS